MWDKDFLRAEIFGLYLRKAFMHIFKYKRIIRMNINLLQIFLRLEQRRKILIEGFANCNKLVLSVPY